MVTSGWRIEVVFIRVRTPTDHGSLERTHQTMTNQALVGQSWPDQHTLWMGLDERRAVLNVSRAYSCSESTNSLYKPFPKPSSRVEPIDQSGKRNSCKWIASISIWRKRRWFRANDHGAVHLGTYDYRFGYRYHKHTMEITFDPGQVAFVCQPEGTLAPMVVPARGLTKGDLMGDLAWMLALPAYQLAFPFSIEDQRRLTLVECLSGTTL